mgnify:CR=1 FL=1
MFEFIVFIHKYNKFKLYYYFSVLSITFFTKKTPGLNWGFEKFSCEKIMLFRLERIRIRILI